jgi:UDP-N-acetylmuramyl pentapeptide phosphotransferase/UDP-N-acetylglucosamine-1-phosphate transferase
MASATYLIILTLIVLAELLYFKLAEKYGIADIPNHRSSHTVIAIRGGGIIFPLSMLIIFVWGGFNYFYFTLGVLLISLVSFYDDIRSVPNRYRLFIQFLSVLLLLIESELIQQPLWIVGLALILIIGTINAYNFMDGINGITGGYSLAITGALYYINIYVTSFVDNRWLIITALTLVVFCFFNFRFKARCFAGDVGSVSIAYILLFFIMLLMVESSDIKYIGLFLVYGLDSVTTIIFRLFRRENIFVAHRSHFYQYLANTLQWPHLRVACLYIISQLMVAFIVINYEWTIVSFVVFVFVSGLAFVGIRFMVEGPQNLLYKQAKS